MSELPDNLLSDDPRFQSFVAWHGEIPPEATRLAAPEASQRAAAWVPQRFAGRVESAGHTVAYQMRERWWILVFELTQGNATKNAENWWIEAYAHDGTSWASNYLYRPSDGSWRHFLHEFRGESYGRHRR